MHLDWYCGHVPHTPPLSWRLVSRRKLKRAVDKGFFPKTPHQRFKNNHIRRSTFAETSPKRQVRDWEGTSKLDVHVSGFLLPALIHWGWFCPEEVVYTHVLWRRRRTYAIPCVDKTPSIEDGHLGGWVGSTFMHYAQVPWQVLREPSFRTLLNGKKYQGLQVLRSNTFSNGLKAWILSWDMIGYDTIFF